MATFVSVDDSLDDVVRALRRGPARVAVDTERAQGYAYGDDAYLVQIRRENGEIFLVDCAGNRDLSAINEALSDCTWILHAADQDIVSLERLNMVPPRLFDTEVAADLCGCDHISLAGLVDDFLGVELPKKFQSANWSKRPLPRPWLEYAAHDVEFLHELMDLLVDRLETLDRLEWAEQESEFVRVHPAGAEPKPHAWRRLRGMRDVRDFKGRAIVYSLWKFREERAEELNLAPHRVLPNNALVWAGKNHVTSMNKLRRFRHRGVGRNAATWKKAFRFAKSVRPEDLKDKSGGESCPFPPVYMWKRDDTWRFQVQQVLNDVQHSLEDALQVPMYRILAQQDRLLVAWRWEHPGDVRRVLEEETDARPWQIDVVEPYFEAVCQEEPVPPLPQCDVASPCHDDD